MNDRWTMHRGEALATLASMPSASVDAIVTDPPYSSGGAFRGDRMGSTSEKYVRSDTQAIRPDFAGDNRDQRSFLTWCTLWLSEALRVAKPGSPIVVFSDWRQLPTTTDAIQAGGWVWRGIVVWDKVRARPTMGRFSAQAEFAVWGTAGASPDLVAVGCLRGVVSIPADLTDERHHQTAKPVATMEQLVAICPPGGVVLDPFAGSGSTGVAALRTGRRFIGIELTEAYHAIACERLEAERAGLTLQAHRAGQVPMFGAKP